MVIEYFAQIFIDLPKKYITIELKSMKMDYAF